MINSTNVIYQQTKSVVTLFDLVDFCPKTVFKGRFCEAKHNIEILCNNNSIYIF